MEQSDIGIWNDETVLGLDALNVEQSVCLLDGYLHSMTSRENAEVLGIENSQAAQCYRQLGALLRQCYE